MCTNRTSTRKYENKQNPCETCAGARAIIIVSNHQEKCWADQNTYCPPKSRYCYFTACSVDPGFS